MSSPPATVETVVRDRREHVVVDRLLPADARALVLDAVLTALDTAGVRGFVVRGATSPGPTVGVRIEDRRAALQALADALPGPGMHLQESYDGNLTQPVVRLTADTIDQVPVRCPAVVVGRLWAVAGGLLAYGMTYGCRVEFWTVGDEGPGMYSAPVANVAGRHFHEDFLTPATTTVEGRERPTVGLFERRYLDDVDFPIDVVYTWVDGDDPAWRERMLRARAQSQGTDYHPEAQSANRYTSRDELKYSLRSLEMFAPWVRNIFLVTDQQVPAWLDTSGGRVTVVDHRDIYADPSVLPVFNSSAIITQLHHIEGLSEHYLYLNDDMFFGADARPEDFWYGSGIAKVFPSVMPRPFTQSHPDDAPHVNITKNIRSAMENVLGRSVSRAIRHTPYPQLRSVNYEIEQQFPEVVATAAQRFRHHEDIAQDQLFHYYAQAVGKAVPDSTLGYSYVNVGLADFEFRLRRLLAARDSTVFCLNDAPEEGRDAISTADVVAFLDAYFPMPSAFES